MKYPFWSVWDTKHGKNAAIAMPIVGGTCAVIYISYLLGLVGKVSFNLIKRREHFVGRLHAEGLIFRFQERIYKVFIIRTLFLNPNYREIRDINLFDILRYSFLQRFFTDHSCEKTIFVRIKLGTRVLNKVQKRPALGYSRIFCPL